MASRRRPSTWRPTCSRGRLYPDYSFLDQAASELFAIGAPTSALVARLFTVSSTLLLPFAAGVWRSSADGTRVQRAIPWMIVANAVDTLILWNLFPMYMRGAERTFTDTMHLVFAENPFIPATIVLAAIAFRRGFRLYSIATRTRRRWWRASALDISSHGTGPGVDAVVEGSVAREGSLVRVTAALIDAATEQRLWGDRYERNLTSVLGLQADMARAVARAMRRFLTSATTGTSQGFSRTVVHKGL